MRCLDAAGTVAEAIAFRGETILAVGARADVLAAAGPDAVLHSLGGATVLPGFIDAHHHVALAALYGGLVRLVPPEVRDVASLQAALRRASAALPPGRWLVAMEWDAGLLAERRAPTRAELDEAVGDRPLFCLHQTCHSALANSRALELAGIDASTPDPPGGAIERGRGGLPTGLLLERGMSRVEALARPDLAAHDSEGFLERVAAHYRALVAVGITGVADLACPVDLLPLYREAVRRGHVLVPTQACPVSATGYLEEPWDVLQGPRSGETMGPLEVGPVKLVLDGAPGCSMCLGVFQSLAALVKTLGLSVARGSLDPLRTTLSIEPRYGLKLRSGVAIYGAADAERVVRTLVESGFGVASHAIGNAAADVALGAYAAAGDALHQATLPRIEHGSFLARSQVARLADLGAGLAVQPSFLRMPLYEHAVSVPGLPYFPLRWLLDAGVPLAGSSDYPVFEFDPLRGMRDAVERTNLRGEVVDRAQRLEVSEALDLYTRGAARVCGWADRAGSLEVGKRADAVVLEGALEPLEAARVRATFVGGALVHGSV
ncbi:MAG: amidohydrolase [Planctomycetota bacterium]